MARHRTDILTEWRRRTFPRRFAMNTNIGMVGWLGSPDRAVKLDIPKFAPKSKDKATFWQWLVLREFSTESLQSWAVLGSTTLLFAV